MRGSSSTRSDCFRRTLRAARRLVARPHLVSQLPNNVNAEPRFQPKLGVWFRPASLHPRSPTSFQPLGCTGVKWLKCDRSRGCEYLGSRRCPGHGSLPPCGRQPHGRPGAQSRQYGNIDAVRSLSSTTDRSAAEAPTLLLWSRRSGTESTPTAISAPWRSTVCVSVAPTDFGRAAQHLSCHAGLSAGALGAPLWLAAISSSQRPEGQVSNAAPSISTIKR